MVYINIDRKSDIHFDSESDLQKSLVKFLKRNEFLFTSTCSELLDTDQLRVEYTKRGYTAGCPDIIIFNSNNEYCGIMIELKSTTGFGDLSDKQKKFLERAESVGKWLCIASNDISELIEMLLKYQNNIPFELIS